MPAISSGCPTPDACELYYIDRDALFSYHRAAEAFLQRMVSIYVASHYKNTPNDLQMMSDAPAHHLFCLLGPVTKKDSLPEILVVVQVCLEGQISSQSVSDSLARGRKASGDLIPWNVSEQFNDREFPKLAGARVVRIATHPNYQRMGYGKRALKLLKNYYAGEFAELGEQATAADDDDDDGNGIEQINDDELGLLKETIAPRKKIPVLLKRLSERRPERLDYIGTSFGLTGDLLKFWKSQKFVPIYLSQKQNELTGEHSTILLSSLNTERTNQSDWLCSYYLDFRRRILKLLAKTFQSFTTGLALSLLDNKAVPLRADDLSQQLLDVYFLPHDVQRLEAYGKNQVEYRLILDTTTDLCQLYFSGRMADVPIDSLQKAILLGIGLQNKSVEQLAEEFGMPVNQVLAKFFDCMKKLTKKCTSVMEQTVESTMVRTTELNRGDGMVATKQSLADEMDEAAAVLEKKQRLELKRLKKESLNEFAIKGTEEEWGKALSGTKSTLVSVKR